MVTAEQIKKLRDLTSVSMGKCKEALEQSKGDIEEAVSILRKSGVAAAVKKEGRSTNEGALAFAVVGNTIAIVEVNAETDFVVRNDRFQQFLREMAQEAAATAPASLELFLQQPYSKEKGLTVDQYRATMIQAIGENIQLRRLKIMKKQPNHSFGLYSHLGGKIVTAAELVGADDQEALAKDIALHIAAAHPEYLNPEQVPVEVVEREKDIARGQVQGKPANIVDKIVAGKLEAYYGTACLTHQKYIRDDQISVQELIERHAKEAGKPLQLVSFLRWSVGG